MCKNKQMKRKKKKTIVKFNYIHTSRCNPVSFLCNFQCNIPLYDLRTLTIYTNFYEGLHKITPNLSNLKYLYDNTFIPHFQIHSILQYALENKNESNKTDQMNVGKSKR